MSRLKLIDGKRYFEVDIPRGESGQGYSPPWIKWGDALVFEFVVPPGGAEVDPTESRQLLRVDYHMPTTWTLRAVYDFQPLADETASWKVRQEITIGVGTASVKLVQTRLVPPVAGVYPQLVIDDVFPASQVNAKVSVGIASNSVTGGLEYVTATLLIAPRVF